MVIKACICISSTSLVSLASYFCVWKNCIFYYKQ